MISFSCEDNDVVALRAFASAMIIIADERGEQKAAFTKELDERTNAFKEHTTETTSLGDAVHKTETVTETTTPTPPPLETVTTNPTMEQGAAAVAAQTGPNGIRWDARIHSRTKSLDGQGNFKTMRQPKVQFPDKNDWLTFVKEVETQLKGATMASPTGATVPQDNDGEPDPSKQGFGKTPPGGMFDKNDAAGDPPPPTLETADTGDTVITFQQVMKTLTSNRAKITAKDLLKICNDYGVDKVVSLKEQEQDVIAAIHDEMLAVINGA